MRYIAKKGEIITVVKDNKKEKQQEFIIQGVKSLPTIDGQEVEVIIDTIKYTREYVEGVIDNLELQYQGMVDKYNADMEDLRKYLTAISEAE